MTPEQLAEIEARTEAATPGPWKVFGQSIAADSGRCNCGAGFPGYPHEPYCPWEVMMHGLPENDAEFIAHARADVPALVAEVQSERARADEAERAAGRYARLYNSATAKYDAIHALFTGGPDTPCRTTWRDGIECVEVPIEDLRRALDMED